MAVRCVVLGHHYGNMPSSGSPASLKVRSRAPRGRSSATSNTSFPPSLHDFKFGIPGDHFLQPVVDEADGELEVVAGALGAKNCAVAVFGMFDARAECPGSGRFPGRRGLEVGGGLRFAAP